MSQFTVSTDFPFCKGCGHHLIARNVVKALEESGLSPLDVILVTDIGCHGIIDRCFTTHTVHGLHGRSVALAAGIAMSVPPEKKTLVFIGDGGATIGLQHILEAARLNVDLKVVVHNNMLYGMTGGQPSGLTPCGFRTTITPQGSQLPSYDLCRLAHDAGAAFAARVIGVGDFSAVLLQALETPGFALLEVLELCTSYGVKLNPQLRLKQLAGQAGLELGSWSATSRAPTRVAPAPGKKSLLELSPIKQRATAKLNQPLALVLGGSAGEGVQSAAELFCQAAISCGLHVAKKGSYPVTVQVGFSTADMLLSPTPVLSHALDRPDIVLITSQDGLQHNLERIQQMESGELWLDASLPAPTSGACLIQQDFRGRAGARNAALVALLQYVQQSAFLPAPAFIATILESPLAKHLPPDLLKL